MNKRLKEVRNLIGLSQTEFAERLFLSHDLISSMERGKRKITERTIEAICQEFDINKEWLVNGNGDIFKDCLKEIDVDEDVKELTRMIFLLDQEDREAILSMVKLLAKKNKI